MAQFWEGLITDRSVAEACASSPIEAQNTAPGIHERLHAKMLKLITELAA